MPQPSSSDEPAAVQPPKPGPGDDTFDFLAPAQAPDEIGRLGPYRVLKVLGRGGMGVVFQAEDPRLGRLCALKAMLPEIARKPAMKERFLREARAAAQIEHDHIIPIYQVDEDRGVPYIAMPFLKGASLEDWFAKKQKTGPTPLPAAQVLKLGREIARGLTAAHDKGLIHRDIKPANIWLDSAAGGRVKILDFGLARLSQAAGEKHLTQSGAILGTPAYMAPEQARGEEVDGRADLFSLGIVLYRLCTGIMPFHGKDPVSTLVSVAMDQPKVPRELNPEVPPALSELVMNLLAKDRDKRPATAKEVVQTLAALEKGTVLPAAAPERTQVTSGPPDPREPVAAVDRAATARTATKGQPAALERGSSRGALIAVLVAVACGFLVLLAAGIVWFLQTPQGTVRLEITDDQTEVQIDRTGAPIKGVGEKDIRVRAGEHGLRIKRGDLEFDTNPFTLRKGETVTLRIEVLDGKVQVVDAAGMVLGEQRLMAEARPNQPVGPAVPPAFFNGKDLTGWKGNPDVWRVEKGEIVGTNQTELHQNLTSTAAFKDYELACRVRLSDETGMGWHLVFRKTYSKETGTRKDDLLFLRTIPGRFQFGGPSGKEVKSERAAIKAGEYNDVLVRVVASRVSVTVNGTVMAKDEEFDIPAEGLIGWTVLPGKMASIRIDRFVDLSRLAVPPLAIDPFDAARAKQHQADWAAHLKLPVEVENKVGMKLVLIPPGGELVPRAYYLGKYEVTQQQWQRVMGWNPSQFQAGGQQQDKVKGLKTESFPVENVTWYDCVAYCNKLSELEGRKPYYEIKGIVQKNPPSISEAEVRIVGGEGYCLPSEAEWEHACRAGSRTKYTFGDRDEDLGDYAWYKDNSDGRTHEVGEKKANRFGLYDIHGNVRERCWDLFEEGALERALRGGAWFNPAGSCAVTFRNRNTAAARSAYIGLRVARVPLQE